MSYEQQVELGSVEDACAVCAMPLAGVPLQKIQHLARNFIVCSPECTAEFYKDPEKYMLPDETEEE